MQPEKPVKDTTLPPTDRAQPGDVLGIENEGERTHLGDTRKDEDDRLREAREAVDRESNEKHETRDDTLLGNERPRVTK